MKKTKKIDKILFDHDNNRFSVSDKDKDYHTKFGFVKSKEFFKKKVKTNLDKEFSCIDPFFIDLYNNKKRDAQIMLKKDIGYIITETGIGKDSFVVEAGGGSGGLGCMIANIAKKVVTYEKREEFVKTIKQNIELMKLKNITVKNKDVKDIEEKDVDVLVLDLVDPEKYMINCVKALKQGGYIVVYVPSITQVCCLMGNIESNKDVCHIKTVEVIERRWKVDKKIARPEFKMLGHTGFLSFFRKM